MSPGASQATPLVMLPGLLLDRRLFQAQIDALSGERTVLVPELAVADDIGEVAEAVLAVAPPTFALLGLSMGGYIAFEIMRRAPERVRCLALLDTQARTDDPVMVATREDRIARADHDFRGVLDELHPSWVHPSRRGDAHLRSLLVEMGEGIGPAGFVREMRAIMSRPDSTSDLAAISCPTLVLCGRQDALTTVPLHEEMAAGIPDATLVVLPGAGHLPTLERPDAVTAQLHIWLEG